MEIGNWLPHLPGPSHFITCPPMPWWVSATWVGRVSPTVGRMETGGVRYQLAECYVDSRLLMDFHCSIIEW